MTTTPGRDDRTNLVLLASTFVIAACGLVYELLAGTVSSYLLGDSVYQFSVVVGVFMASMGLGSYLSRHIQGNLPDFFVAVQIAVGVLGGLSAAILFYAFSHLDNYAVFLFLISIAIGALIGFEIPVVIRILREYRVLKINVSNVLTVDYVGALAAALLFPIVLVPQLGLLRTAFFFGLLNLVVAALGLFTFRQELKIRPQLITATVAAATLLGFGFYRAESITGFFEHRLYADEIIHAETTPYQRIVITRDGEIISLFINGGLQFNSLDEYRYHESLVHPAMSLARRRHHLAILGGGDGMAMREVLKYRDVESVTLIDLDPAVTRLFATNPILRRLHGDAYRDARVTVVNQDAWRFLESSTDRYDVVIIDLPDPHDVSMSRLYTRAFYTLVAKRLTADGILVTQATSPLYAREAFWCIEQTLSAVTSPYNPDSKLFTLPYHAYVPSFGEWGFVMASPRFMSWKDIRLSASTRFLTMDALEHMTRFPPDMERSDVDVNTLQTHKLPYYYQDGWSRWYR